MNNELKGNPKDVDLLNKKHELLVSLGKKNEVEEVLKEIFFVIPETLINDQTITLDDKEGTYDGFKGILPTDTIITISGVDFTFRAGSELWCNTKNGIH